MSKYSKISELMKRDWDRRVKHDYRFWMSDGRKDDSSMWESGKRDFELLCGDIDNTSEKVILELGCGVGRLLHSTVGKYKKVIGIDVSAEAIEKARELIPGVESLELIAGNGTDLHPVQDNSVDIVYSFAAITSIPTDVIANYLREIHRVLKSDGLVRLQIYLGEEQPVHNSDTLHLRCYAQGNFEAAASLAGFEVDSIEELLLPFQVSYDEVGFRAMKISLKPKPTEPALAEIISRALLPTGETDPAEAGKDDLEYWMTVNYAKELMDEGDYEKAQETLEYALSFSKSTTIDIRDLLDRIANKLDSTKGTGAAGTQSGSEPVEGSVLFQKNLSVLKERFPEAYQAVVGCIMPGGSVLEVKETPDGPVVYYKGQCLDHMSKPVSSGRVWAKRALNDALAKKCRSVAVFGFGSGYHIEGLLEATDLSISIIEPNAAVFRSALENRDLASCLSRLKTLSVGEGDTLTDFDEDCELVVRPQSQMAALNYHKKVRSHFYATRGIKSIHPRFAVLGPLQGGTLPILGYTIRALLMERQRVRDIDVSGFASGYHAVADVVTGDILQISAQGKYIEAIAKIALDSITEKPIDVLICMAQAPVTLELLDEIKKRGILTVLWFVEDYQRFATWQALAPHFDYIFTIQKGECIQAIKEAGCEEVHYLPTACDPMIHAPLELTPEDKERWGSPVSFMGAGYHNRQQTFAALAGLPFKIWGTEWPGCKPFDKLVQEGGRRLKPDEYVKIFNASDININLHSSTERDGVDPNGDFLNPRTFELASIGAFQLVDERSLLAEVLEPGTEVATFSNTEDLKEKIGYYLEHKEEARAIAERGRARVLQEHTYQHRIKEMLSIIYANHYEHLKARCGQDPWVRMLERSKPFPELHERCKRAYERGDEPDLEGLVSDIVSGQGSLTETEQILLFLYHVSQQIIRMKHEEDPDKQSL